MKILVTQEDIDNSLPRNGMCPVERAMERATNKLCWGGYFLMGPKSESPIETPYNVRSWMIAFDSGKSVSPFEFEVEL